MSKGIRYMLLSTMLFAVMNLFVKYVPHIPAIEIIFFRSIISLFISYVVLLRKKIPVFGNNKPMLVLRGIVGAAALILFFTTLQNIPLAAAVTIQYLNPIFTTILGVFIVKEKVKSWQWLFFILSFSGVIIIEGLEPEISPFYAILGVSAAICSGLAYNIIRKLKNEHPMVIVFYFPLVALPVTAVYVAFNWVMPVGWDWFYLIAIGLLTQFAQYYMTKSYQAEELSKVANYNFLGIIYALLFGFIFFGEVLSIWSYLGIFLVIAGILLNTRYKLKLDRNSIR